MDSIVATSLEVPVGQEEKPLDVATSIEGVEGWCTLHKATALHRIASSVDCNLAVEVGIYGGKSLLPVAAAFANKNAGVIYGIEPWQNSIATETVTNASNDQWWSSVDLLAVKRGFFKRVNELGLEKYVRILEIPSDAAIPVFQSARFADKIDLVHVDGAHSVECSVFDCSYWFRLLRPGGYLVLDDINWPSVGTAFRFMQEVAALVELADAEDTGHFAVFRKRRAGEPVEGVEIIRT